MPRNPPAESLNLLAMASAAAINKTGEELPLIAKQDDDNDELDEETSTCSIAHDIGDTMALGAPIFLSMLSWVGMKTTDSALLGHVSADALAAAALSDLWTMCTLVLINNARVLGVLCAGAFGAGNHKLAGIYLQVSYYVLSYVAVFVFVCWYFTERVWLLFGSNPHLAAMAGYYAKALAFSIPGQLAFSQLAQYFSSQRIMHPEMNAASIAMILNVIFGVIFVLGFPFPGFDGFGFAACPIVTTTVVYAQIFILWFVYVHIQRLHEPCWGGWSWEEITWTRIKTFCELYVPAALGAASDFWRVAAIGAVAAKLGDVEVAVFNTSYRIMWIVLILVSALSTAAGIKTSQRLGKRDHQGAKQAGWVGIIMSAAILVIIGALVLWKNRAFGRIFTEDPVFLNMFEESKVPFTLTLVLMNMSVAIERIPYSMGRTKEVFWYGFVASWGAQVPGVILLTRYWQDDLIRLYWGMAIGYLVLVILYASIVLRSDWKIYAELAVLRSESN